MLRKALHGFLSYTAPYLFVQKAFGAHRMRKLSAEVLGARSGDRILDIGCGPAYILEYLPPVQYYGFDTERHYIAHARRIYGDRGVFYTEQFTDAHVRTLAPFDGILLMGLLHHLSDDECRGLLGLLQQCLAPNGKLLTLDPCFVDGQSTMSRLVASFDRGRYVRTQPEYRALVDPYFSAIECNIISNVGRLPSIELIMQVGLPRSTTSLHQDKTA